MTETYRVGGMTCGGCVAAVTRAIRNLDPQAKVAVDLASGEVMVEGAVARDAVRRAVEAAGFSVEG
jgi:copper chaperone